MPRYSTVLLLLAIGATSCSETRNSTGMISQRIGQAVHADRVQELDLTKLTTFGWAYFYAFKPGTAREEICKFIGAGRNTCGRIIRIERAPDDHMFMIFGLNGQLTHVELHAVENGIFDIEFTDGGYPRERSVFKVRRSSSSSGKDSVHLEPR
jgi:hypothetical protein